VYTVAVCEVESVIDNFELDVVRINASNLYLLGQLVYAFIEHVIRTTHLERIAIAICYVRRGCIDTARVFLRYRLDVSGRLGIGPRNLRGVRRNRHWVRNARYVLMGVRSVKFIDQFVDRICYARLAHALR